MLTDITLGQYFAGESFLHKLDPRVKIISAVVLLVFIFLASNAFSVLFLICITGALIAFSRIPFSTFLQSIKMLSFILIISFLFIAFGYSEEYTHKLFEVNVFDLFTLRVFAESIEKAVVMNIRIISLILITSLVLTYTTSPIELTDGIERVLTPLNKLFGLPVHDFAMIMSIALRFIPTLLEETDKIMSAQSARGADFKNGSIMQRVKALLPVFIPLLISSFRRAIELATAMECRCYHGGDGRTKMKRLKLVKRDYCFCVFVGVVAVAIVALNMLPDLTQLIYR
ncbi:MAG: energy-coupling factor transporter transmembrane protein EcfT [Ruminococcaceae bacterium]|nr:energy-coupling factor transporter transmembrane protein EcfT [Oscillospiraceae bacterium]